MPAHPVTVLRVPSRGTAPTVPLPVAELRGVRHGPLHELDLALAAGEVLVLLGGPGAGKSAVIDLLAGFARPRAGEVLLDGVATAGVPPHRRRLGLVLAEDGPLPGHNVAGTIGFGGAGADAVGAAMQLFGLAGLGEQRAAGLSPEQRVRCALARAMAAAPRLLLLDEPFAGLAAAARDAVLADLRPALGDAACLLATAEPATALAMQAGVALLEAGRLLQRGPAQAVYDEPASAAAARLLGPANLLPGRVEIVEDGFALVRLDCGLTVEAAGPAAPGRALVCLRPERIAVAPGRPEEMGEGALPAHLAALAWRGDHVRIELTLGADSAAPAKMQVTLPAGVPLAGLEPGSHVAIAWQARHARVLPLPTPS